MTTPASIAIAGLTALFVAAGFVFGYGYFLSLRRSVELYAARRTWLPPLFWVLGVRIGAAALFFAVVARWGAAGLGQTGRQWGAVALLAAFAGFLVARQLAVRSARSAA